MKFILFFSLFVSSITWAQSAEIDSSIIYVTGHGSAIGTCSGTQFFCLEQVKDNARRQAEQEARWQCQVRQGIPQFGASCYDSCIPSYLPPDGSYQTVSCRSDCQLRCEVGNALPATE